MADLEAYRDKFGESGQRVLENALGESKRRDQNYIAVEHIIHALAREESELFNSTIRSLAIDPETVRRSIDKRLDNAGSTSVKDFESRPIQPIYLSGLWSGPVRAAARQLSPLTFSTCF